MVNGRGESAGEPNNQPRHFRKEGRFTLWFYFQCPKVHGQPAHVPALRPPATDTATESSRFHAISNWKIDKLPTNFKSKVIAAIISNKRGKPKNNQTDKNLSKEETT